MPYFRTIDDLVDDLRRDRKVSLLIGAGCSVSAGIPLARDIVEEIRQKYPLHYERAREKCDGETPGYPQCMSMLPPRDRRDLINPYIDKSKINWAHLGIALLVAGGYVDRVLTTNFDPLIQQACALVYKFPAIYDFAASQEFKPEWLPEKAVFYLHGQNTGFRTLNTPEECDSLREDIGPVFTEASQNRTWVVVGYSGDNDPVFEQLTSKKCFDLNLYWVGFRENDPSKRVREDLLEACEYAFFIRGKDEKFDADSFFIELAQKLGLFPPSFVEDPFAHVEKTFEQIIPYNSPFSDDDGDILDPVRKRVRAAKQREQEEREDVRAETGEFDPNVVREMASVLFMKGAYHKVCELSERHPGAIDPDTVYWAVIRQGIVLGERADKSPPEVARSEYLSAIEFFKKAAEGKKEKPHQAFYNWGVALSKLTDLAEGAEREPLLHEEIGRYEAAVAAKPDMHEALFNWGLALAKLADLAEGAKRESLLHEAIGRYEAAVAAKPDYHEALSNWGAALATLADLAEGAERESRLHEAIG
ncbi:MAG: hypothetical protein P9L99_17020, partial [Candidatus Lernaella stagnicola]|nr:hypothetical protein [Candidatus Lernaella stagnicola]